jgi:OFA family oxalate/formate antiporter-like MFS transporter
VKPPNRWLPVVGGVMMNMALGTFYAMSAFMLPLEKEFGWTRAQTSWVTTIGIVMIASWYVIAGYIHDRRGPQLVAAVGGALFSAGLLLASFTQSLITFYATAGVIAGTGSGFGYVVPT